MSPNSTIPFKYSLFALQPMILCEKEYFWNHSFSTCPFDLGRCLFELRDSIHWLTPKKYGVFFVVRDSLYPDDAIFWTRWWFLTYCFKNITPKIGGKWSNLTVRIFFKWVVQPPTSLSSAPSCADRVTMGYPSISYMKGEPTLHPCLIPWSAY